jgi:3-oxosteroid 1-dehydrogenase
MKAFDETFDFVVVGSGAGSMCAALVMRSAGKSVLILEKLAKVGGTTARSGGVMWLPNNPFMAQAGVADSLEAAATYLDHVVGDDPSAPGASRERRLAFLRQAPRMVAFLQGQGVRLKRVPYWPDYYDERPGGSRAGRTVVAEMFDLNELGPWRHRLHKGFAPVAAEFVELALLPHFRRHPRAFLTALRVALRMRLARFSGKSLVMAGEALQGRMLQAALRAGVEFRLEAPVGKLIVEDGAVAGVCAMIDGRVRHIGARLGVLVNAGGFSRNQAMRDRHQPGTSVDWTLTFEGDTGEMIQEMARHGAALAQMEEFVGAQITRPLDLQEGQLRPMAQKTTAAPHCILVDQSGVRYQNEGGSYMAYCKAMLERNRTVPAIPSWAILDDQYMSKYMLAGAPHAVAQSWEQQGLLKKADTLEELARLLSMCPATLRGAIERFNGFVAKGRDEDFGRGDRAYDRWLGDPFRKCSPTLGAITRPPFYALPIYPGDVGTCGGVVTDVHARVLRADGSPIPGLYATATSTASVMGRTYPGAGSSIGPGFVWGFVAARHAARLDHAELAGAAAASAAAILAAE